MSTLFGVPMDNVMWLTSGLCMLIFLAVGVLALRRRVFFKMAMRNIPRRRSQTVLIVLGLMLSTMLMTAAFGTGDTMTYTLRTAFLGNLGGIDLQVGKANPSGVFGGQGLIDPRLRYFPENVLHSLKQRLAGDERIEAVAGWSRQPAPVIDLTSRQSSAQTAIIGLPGDYGAVYGSLQLRDGGTVGAGELAAGEALVDSSAAEKLDAKAGDTLRIFASGAAHEVRLRGVIDYGPPGFAQPTLALALPTYQQIFGAPGQLTSMGLALRGEVEIGSELSKDVARELRDILGDEYSVSEVKVQGLQQAETVGNVFTTLFIALALFSIAAGVLLIFLIFVMLAAERKPEMGMARAVGAQRTHITMMFVFEGLAYDLAAAVVGAAMGVLAGWAMVELINAAFAQFGFSITRHVEPRSVVVALTIGLLVTFVTVAVSASRVSRLNIVAAIRDTPEPVAPEPRILTILGEPFRDMARATRRKRYGELIAVCFLGVPRALLRALLVFLKSGPLALLLGALLAALGADGDSAFLFTSGASLLIVGGGLATRWLLERLRVRAERRDRVAYSIIGVGLLIFWSLPFDAVTGLLGLPQLSVGIEMFFLAGIMMVAGAVWTIIYNSDILLGLLTLLFGRAGRMAPVIKTAVAYPMAARFRTGLTLAMFALIIFVLIVMAVSVEGSLQAPVDRPSITGGWDIHATVNVANPLADMGAAVAKDPNLAGKFEIIAGVTRFPAEFRQPGVPAPAATPGATPGGNPGYAEGWRNYIVRMADDAYLANVQYVLATRAEGYGSDREVWEAIREDPSLAVADQIVVPSGRANRLGFAGGNVLELQGVAREDKTMPPLPLQARLAGSPALTLTIIGVLARGPSDFGLISGRPRLLEQSPLPVPITDWYFKIVPGQDVQELRRALGSAFLANGLEPVVIVEDLRAQQAVGGGFNGLLQGFMGLGLLVGVAALGVISTRAVVERRQQIGVLRAIGYQRGMIAASFLLETSFIALLGIVIGVVLGIILAYNLWQFSAQDNPNFSFAIPWGPIGLIILIAYAFSLLTTFLPALQASRVYPAEALRYE